MSTDTPRTRMNDGWNANDGRCLVCGIGGAEYGYCDSHASYRPLNGGPDPDDTPRTPDPLIPVRLRNEKGEPIRCDCGFGWFVPRSAGIYACDACGNWYGTPPYTPEPMQTDDTPRTTGETLEAQVRELLGDFQDAIENEAAAYEWGYPRGVRDSDEARNEIVAFVTRLERDHLQLREAYDAMEQDRDRWRQEVGRLTERNRKPSGIMGGNTHDGANHINSRMRELSPGLWAEMPTEDDIQRETYYSVECLSHMTGIAADALIAAMQEGRIPEAVDVGEFWVCTLSAVEAIRADLTAQSG